jgi:hypothetical protein
MVKIRFCLETTKPHQGARVPGRAGYLRRDVEWDTVPSVGHTISTPDGDHDFTVDSVDWDRHGNAWVYLAGTMDHEEAKALVALEREQGNEPPYWFVTGQGYDEPWGTDGQD